MTKHMSIRGVGLLFPLQQTRSICVKPREKRQRKRYNLCEKQVYLNRNVARSNSKKRNEKQCCGEPNITENCTERRISKRLISISLTLQPGIYSWEETPPSFFVQKAEKYSFNASTVPLPSTSRTTIPT